MARRLKDKLKELFFLIYKFAGRWLGIHIIPVHYYSAEPDIHELQRTMALWEKPASLLGIHIDLDEQISNLKKICLPFQEEYRGNTSYKTAVSEQYGPGYGYIEAQALHAVVRHYRPSLIIEVGSGVSTFCAFNALTRNGVSNSTIKCIEPNPRPKLLMLEACSPHVRIIRQPVQAVPLDTFATLSENDILFIDSSHVVKAGSDTLHIMLEILPRLRRGTLVHFHDIYFPYDYQRDLLKSFLHNNETPFLRAFLTFNNRFVILFCLSHLHYERREQLKAVFPEYEPQSGRHGLQDEHYAVHEHFPSSIWLQVL